MTIDIEQVCSQLAARKLRIKSSIELTRLLIDQSFLRLKVSHRSLYAAQQSQERLDRFLKAIESGTVSPELCSEILLHTRLIGTALPLLKDSHSSVQSLWIFPRSAFQVLSCSLFASSNRACRASLLATFDRNRIDHTINPTNRVTTTTPRNSIIQKFSFYRPMRIW
jgi:hypothetical protein